MAHPLTNWSSIRPVIMVVIMIVLALHVSGNTVRMMLMLVRLNVEGSKHFVKPLKKEQKQ